MADPLSLAVLSASITGLLMRGAAVAVDPSWGSAASLPSEALNAWRSLRRLQQGRGGQENPLEASIKSRLQKQVDAASERYKRTGATQSALAGAVTEMEVALRELSGDDDAVVEAVRFPDHFERYLRRRTAGHRRYVEAAAEPFFDDLTRIVAEEFIRLAPGSRGFDIAALKQLLAVQDQLVAGQKQLLEGQAETHELLGTMATDIKEIHSTIPQSQPASPTRIRFGYRPRVTAGFVKREGQDELFDAVFTRAEPRTVLTGMRGSGKTQLAATVATRCEEEGWPLVAWIDAESRDVLIANLYNLALQTGINAPKDVPPETIVRRFLDQLRSADAADRLFVFDNVENLDDLKDLTPEGNGIRATITTTRHLDWESLGWSPMAVGVFDREQSIALLCQRTGDAHRDAAGQIAEALGDLPVAVTQAAATAKWGHYSLSEYFIRLSTHSLESSISRLEGDDYPEAVGVALFMAYEQALEQINSKYPWQERIAISLLDTLSLLAASGVPTHWLLKLNKDSDTVRDTLSFLKRSSIIQESTDGSKTIIHRLQGQVYRETYLCNQEKIAEASVYVTALLNGIDVDKLRSFDQRRKEVRSLVEQIRSVAQQDHSHLLLFNPVTTGILARALRYAYELAMPQLALTLAEAVDQAGDIFPNHPDTLTSRNNLASAYNAVGRLDDAIALHEQNLKDSTRILGPNHPDTLTSRNNLANAYQAAGRLHDAITLHEQNLKDRTRILGPNHPHTLATRSNLAGTYQEAGRLQEATKLYEQNLKDRTRILGPNHPHTLATRDDLAEAYREAGKVQEAITLCRQTYEDSSCALGPDHPDTLATRHTLASTYQVAGRFQDAIELHQQNLEDRTRILGPHHPDTLATRSNLASAYQDAGRLNDAITLFEENLKEFKDLLGPDNPHTLTTLNNLAAAYHVAGRLDETITLDQQTLEDRTRILGPDHPDTLASRNNLAYTYQTAGRLNEAITLHQQTLEDRTRILGPDHPDTLASRDGLAYAYQAAGRLNEAITLYKQSLEDATRILGPDNPSTLASRNHLAGAYCITSRIDEAITLYQQNLDSCTQSLGPDHPDTLASRNTLAYAYQDAGRIDEAITLYQQNLEDRIRILGPDHPHTLASRNALAYAYQDAGRLQDAITLYEQNLENRTRVLGPHHWGVLYSRSILADAYRAEGRLDKTITLYQQNLDSCTQSLGPDHRGTLNSRNTLANAYQDAGRIDEAIDLHQQNLKDRTHILGPHHPHTLTTRNNLAEAYRAAGRFEDADKLFGTPSDSEEEEQDSTEDNADQETDS